MPQRLIEGGVAPWQTPIIYYCNGVCWGVYDMVERFLSLILISRMTGWKDWVLRSLVPSLLLLYRLNKKFYFLQSLDKTATQRALSCLKKRKTHASAVCSRGQKKLRIIGYKGGEIPWRSVISAFSQRRGGESPPQRRHRWASIRGDRSTEVCR